MTFAVLSYRIFLTVAFRHLGKGLYVVVPKMCIARQMRHRTANVSA